MRTKLVLWGTNASDERVLLALELLPDDNQVAMHVIPADLATDDFTKRMMDDWREDRDVPFPEGIQTITRPLSMTEDLIPEEYKVERGDVVQRAQSEWAFVVLSYKMQKTFQSELDAFHEKIQQLTEFSSVVWEELKAFWDKVQAQVRERNLFREHVAGLREQSNELFTQMKKLRQAADTHFRKQSSEVARSFSEKLEAIQEKIQEGKHLINTFEELKKLQREYHDLTLSRDDRNKLWNRMDTAFKLIKEKRFGDKPVSGAGDALTRVERRYKGLISALDKMTKSIERDQKDLDFEERRANASEGQLEMQIRQAKLNMISERLNSKKEKLADMHKTRDELEQRMAGIRARVADEEAKQKVEEAKLAVKERIAREIEETKEELEPMADKLEAAAADIAGTPEGEEGSLASGSLSEAAVPDQPSSIGEAEDLPDPTPVPAVDNEEPAQAAIEDTTQAVGETDQSSPEDPTVADDVPEPEANGVAQATNGTEDVPSAEASEEESPVEVGEPTDSKKE